jgi:hypothetical protein
MRAANHVGWAEQIHRDAQQTQSINTSVLKEDWGLLGFVPQPNLHFSDEMAPVYRSGK